MRTLCLTFFCSILALFTFGQTFSLTPFADFNTTFIGIKTEKTPNRDIELKPGMGFNSGIISRLSFNEKSNLDFALAFKQRRNQGDLNQQFASVLGGTVNAINNRTINNYLGAGIVYNYKFPFSLYIGSGLELNFLLFSKTKISLEDVFGRPLTIAGIPLDNKFRNYSFRTFNIGIPIIISYEIKRLVLSLKFEKGLLSRIKNSEIKERENTLSFGIGYTFKRKEKTNSSSSSSE